MIFGSPDWGITSFQALHRLFNGDGPWIPTTLQTVSRCSLINKYLNRYLNRYLVGSVLAVVESFRRW